MTTTATVVKVDPKMSNFVGRTACGFGHGFLSTTSTFSSFPFSPTNSSNDTSYNLASSIKLSVSGDASALSHFEIACLETFNLSANSYWERLFFFLNS